MERKLKIWAGLSVAVLVGQAQAMPIVSQPQSSAHFILTAAGEAGESGTVAKAADGQSEYIAALGLIDAYVRLADKLDSADARARAKKLALDLSPTLKKHKAALSAKALKKLSTAQIAIKAARGTGEDVSAHSMVVAVLSLVQNANQEFSTNGISRKYKGLSAAQKAWGQVQAAKSIMADITPQERDEHKAPLQEIDVALASLDPLWPDLKHDQPTKADPALLAAAAAKIEFASSAIK